MYKLKGYILVLIMIFTAYGEAFSTVYQWEDSNGVHFTDNPDQIPKKFRNKAIEMSISTEPEAQTENKVQGNSDVRAAQPQPSNSAGQQRDEEIWRNRFGSLRKEKKELQEGMVIKRERLAEIHKKRILYQKISDRIAYNQIDSEIKSDEKRIEEIDKKLEELEIEAAKEAVPLEWRR